MAVPRTIEIDLYRDRVEICRTELIRFGYAIAGIIDDAELMRIYLNVCHRLVSVHPRQILKSKDFSCSPEHQGSLTQIERVTRNGGDLTPYLSRKILNAEYNDPLLNDWGIHHLHLGANTERDGFVSRTGPLLFCRFEDEKAYFIDVLKHGSWTMQRLLETMHENWPGLLSQFQLHGVKGDRLTDRQIETLRNKRLNYCIEMKDGTVYGPPGGGITSAGTNMIDVAKADYIFFSAQKEQQRIIDNIEEIAADAHRQGVVLPDPARFRLRDIDGQFYAVEVNSKIGVPLDSLS
ncbi:MAG: hypothetical protein OXG22_08720 [Chloroflexi bacterium]|nr:hypothetical protein [Chloroflexota bacterium]